jgi:hypothetical protein
MTCSLSLAGLLPGVKKNQQQTDQKLPLATILKYKISEEGRMFQFWGNQTSNWE